MKHRRATTVLEVTMSLLILATVVAAVAQTLAVVQRQHRLAQRRLAASQTAANLMERITAREWDELTGDRVDALAASYELPQILSTANVEVQAAESTGAPAAKRVEVAVRWRDAADGPGNQVRLVAWRFAHPGENDE